MKVTEEHIGKTVQHELFGSCELLEIRNDWSGHTTVILQLKQHFMFLPAGYVAHQPISTITINE